MPSKTKKPPKYQKLILQVDPSQGAAALAANIVPPEGYLFLSMERRGGKATIKFVRDDMTEKVPVNKDIERYQLAPHGPHRGP